VDVEWLWLLNAEEQAGKEPSSREIAAIDPQSGLATAIEQLLKPVDGKTFHPGHPTDPSPVPLIPSIRQSIAVRPAPVVKLGFGPGW